MSRRIKIAGVLLILLVQLACHSGSKKSSDGKAQSASELPVMKFDSLSADFGEVKEGEKVVLFYTFENVGGDNLVIYEALPSCGCTTPKYDDSPVKPGEKRTVEVVFDSEGWSGLQQKSITFKTNGLPDYTTITLTGTVN